MNRFVGNAEFSGNILLFPFVNENPNRNVSRRVVELFEHLHSELAIFGSERGVIFHTVLASARFEMEPIRAASEVAVMIPAVIGCDADYPWNRFFDICETVLMFEEPNENLLSGVLGLFAIAKQAQTSAIYNWAKPRIELADELRIGFHGRSVSHSTHLDEFVDGFLCICRRSASIASLPLLRITPEVVAGGHF